MTDYNKLSESLVRQLEAHGVAVDNDQEIYVVKDFVEGTEQGYSYYSYLSSKLEDLKADQESAVQSLQKDFYERSLQSMDKQQEEASQPVYQISREDVLSLEPTEASQLRTKIGAEAYRSIMEGAKTPIQQIMEDEPEDNSISFEQYRGSDLQSIKPSVAQLIYRYNPEIYASLIK